ncbi:hypothetical protein CIK74_08150 [Glutamicibacter sp. BW77]|nr:hypothetical protein CIK74_08150 [Glutamicibacter sp. BW77]
MGFTLAQNAWLWSPGPTGVKILRPGRSGMNVQRRPFVTVILMASGPLDFARIKGTLGAQHKIFIWYPIGISGYLEA